jgi:hypothetical protein
VKSILALISLLAAPGCVFVSAVSYSNVTPKMAAPVPASDWTLGALHLTEPGIEGVVSSLNRKIGPACPAGLANVQTVVTTRDYLVVQVYGVRLTAQCESR